MALSSKQQALKKKIQMQNMIILALAIVIIVLIVLSSTAAWYIRTKSDSADLILSNPVNIYMTEFETKLNKADNTYYNEHTTVEDILDGYNNKIYPGDKIELNFGVQLGTKDEPSSPAYVRVQFNLAISKISTNPDDNVTDLEILQGNYLNINDDAINSKDWVAVDFNNPNNLPAHQLGEDHVADIWYVLKDSAGGKISARAMQDGEQIEFLNGDITLSRTEITNKFANHKFHITYSVQAIQTANIANPITEWGSTMCPWWAHEEIKYE